MDATVVVLAVVALQVLAVLLFRAVASWNGRMHPEPGFPGAIAAGDGGTPDRLAS